MKEAKRQSRLMWNHQSHAQHMRLGNKICLRSGQRCLRNNRKESLKTPALSQSHSTNRPGSGSFGGLAHLVIKDLSWPLIKKALSIKNGPLGTVVAHFCQSPDTECLILLSL